MKIQEKDLFHGAALTQIVEHESFKALNLASRKYGHYLVNTDREVFIKYRKNSNAPYQFTFAPDDVHSIAAAMNAMNRRVFVSLVCGDHTVCALNETEIPVVLNLQETETQQTVTVEVPSGGSCHVHGTNGKLSRVVPHNSFPAKVFA